MELRARLTGINTQEPGGDTLFAQVIRYTEETVMREQWHEALQDGTPVFIRPIWPEDANSERRFIEELSPESRYFRFLGAMRSPSPDLIQKLTNIDHDRDAAYIALIREGNDQRQIGVARYSLDADGQSCECAVAVSDDHQNKGLGTLLMRHLIERAREKRLRHMYSVDATENRTMWKFADRLGFKRHNDPNDACLTRHCLELNNSTI